MSQPNDPTYGAPPSPAPTGSAPIPPADSGEHIHAHERMVLAVVRGVTYFVYGLILVIQVILGLGFILLLLGANPSTAFVEWWYRNLDRVMQPFRGIFTSIELGTTTGNVQSVFETSILFAMIIYAIIGIAIYSLAHWFTRRLQQLDREDREYHERRAVERQAALDRQATERAAYIQAGQQPPPQTQQSTTPPPPPR